jgi:oxygen-independent coproporphyrinogen-3 oxidase
MPTMTDEKLRQNLRTAFDYGIEHISAYGLSIEPNTILERKMQKDEYFYEELDKKIASQYIITHNFLSEKGFEHYETSNFAKNQKYSLHNTNYWNRTNYIGFGASAHSLIDDVRSWNVNDVKEYCERVRTASIKEHEHLTPQNKYNEYVMTAIRTMWGIDLEYIRSNFPQFWEHFSTQCKLIPENYVQLSTNKLQTTVLGSLFADKIAEILFL